MASLQSEGEGGAVNARQLDDGLVRLALCSHFYKRKAAALAKKKKKRKSSGIFG